MQSGFSITKHNDLVTSAYRLSLTEMQIILYGISLINPMDGRFPRAYEINIKKFGEMFNRKHSEIYNDVKDAVMRRFWDREFTFHDKYETNRVGEVVRARAKWITTVKYSDKAGFIKIFFNPEIEEYLHNLKNKFTTYHIKQISEFKRFYSVRFYELFVMHLNQSKVNKAVFKVSIVDIRDIFDLKNKYRRFSNLKNNVLDPALKEINDLSDLQGSCTIIKQGRTPNEIKFIVTRPDPCLEEPVVLAMKQKGSRRKRVSTNALEKAKIISLLAGTGWDIYTIEEQFYDFMKKKGEPDSVDGAFIGFVKKKVARTP